MNPYVPMGFGGGGDPAAQWMQLSMRLNTCAATELDQVRPLDVSLSWKL